MKLHEITKNGDVASSLVQQMYIGAPILQDAEFYQISGNADTLDTNATATGGQFRTPNTSYAQNVVTPAETTVSLKIFGDDVRVDRAFERRNKIPMQTEIARQLFSLAQKMGKNFVNMLFDGDETVDAKQFNGFKKLCTQVYNQGQNGLVVLSGNGNTEKKSQDAFLELLDFGVRSVENGADAIYMNSALISRLTTIAKAQCQTTIDSFGVRVTTYNGVPVRDPGMNSSRALILDFNEKSIIAEGATGSETFASIFFVKYGEKERVTCATNNGVNYYDLGIVGSHNVRQIELDAGVALQNSASLSRFTGIKLG